MGLFWQQLTSQRRLFLLSLLTSPAKVLRTIVAPLLTAQIFTNLALAKPVTKTQVTALVLCFVIGVSLDYISGRSLAIMDAQSIKVLYSKCFEKLVSEDYNFYSSRFAGSLVSQVSRFVKAYEQFTAILFNDVLTDVVSAVATLCVMAYFSPMIAGLCLIVLVATVLLNSRLIKQRIAVSRLVAANESIQTGELADMTTNSQAVKTYASEAFEISRYNRVNTTRTKHLRKSWLLSNRDTAVNSIMAALLNMAVLFGGIWAIQNNNITIAIFLLFQVYILRVISTVYKVAYLARSAERLLSDASEMTLLLSQKPTVQDPINPNKSKINEGSIDFKNVRFCYPEDMKRNKSLFNNLNLSIEAGENVGLVGSSGGGKTSITKLLLRFMDIQKGVITIDGQDIASITQKDLHRAITYVPQEPILFHRTILENIAYGQHKATKPKVIQAAKKAQAHGFIMKLPKGYNTLVGERGVKLSGGQRQRIAIARAILKEAPVLIMDEATSALDSTSEKYIQEALKELMSNRTSIVIAHRLSTIQKMDRIIVLDNGSIIEQGKHDMLLAKNGTYAKLWQHQSGGFLKD